MLIKGETGATVVVALALLLFVLGSGWPADTKAVLVIVPTV
jgi:hypothetical protein